MAWATGIVVLGLAVVIATGCFISSYHRRYSYQRIDDNSILWEAEAGIKDSARQQEKMILYQEAVLGSEKLKQDVRTKELISTIDNCHNSHPKQQTMTIMDSILKIWKDNQYSFFSLNRITFKINLNFVFSSWCSKTEMKREFCVSMLEKYCSKSVTSRCVQGSP